MTFTLAIVGRPNVGKSTLFNRLVGKRIALVDDTPGVTRDRREGDGHIGDLSFRVIDTAGLEDAPDESLEGRMRQQTERAMAEADLILMLIDARVGLTPVDEHFADLLRRGSTPVVMVANKCEGQAGHAGVLEAFALGFGDPIALSAEHGQGFADLYQAILPHIEPEGAAPEPEEEFGPEEEGEAAEDAAEDAESQRGPLQLAIVGRPNVGKSTLVNRLIGEDRLLTGPEAGITRDAIAVEWSHDGRALRLIDTAGLRRRMKVQDNKLERLSTEDTARAIRYAQVVVLVLDSDMMLEKQDLTIARQVIDEGRALVIAANKWDAVEDKREALERLHDRLETSLPQVRGIPVVTVSALRGLNLDRLMKAVFDIYATWNARVPTGRLNQWLEGMVANHPPPLGKAARRVKLRYMTQVKSRPPTFSIWVSRPEDLPEAYVRYIANGLRDDFGLEGVPLRINTRKGRNPYATGGRS